MNYKERLKSIENFYFGKEEQKESILITEDDFDKMSQFERKTIINIAKMYNMLKDPNDDVDYNMLINVINKLTEGKNDNEKQYLISLFFPEKVKHINIIYPFPVPTYPYIQKTSGRISPNSKGNFVLQAVCPILVDTESLASNLYINSDEALDGVNLDTNLLHFKPVAATRCIKGAFNAYVLQCLKITVEYIGRVDIQSGIFGGAYYVSTAKSLEPDVNCTLFDYIDDSINSVKVDSRDGLSVIYYPLDVSYTHFMTVNTDNVSTHAMNTSLRLAIYGSSLPNGSSEKNGSPNCVNYTINAIYNIIPSQEYNELLPVDFMLKPQDSFDLVKSSSFISQAKLSSFPTSKTGEIERMLSLPSNLLSDAVQTLKADQAKYGKGSNNNTILDILKPIIGNYIPTPIKLSKTLLLDSGKEEKAPEQKMETDEVE